MNLVTEIHMVCNKTDRHGQPLNVRKVTTAHFVSGYWPIARAHLRRGVVFALHKSIKERSFLQGRIEDVEEVEGKRVEVRVGRTSKPLLWAGLGARGRAYKYGGQAIADDRTKPFVPPDISSMELRRIVSRLASLREGQPTFRKNLLGSVQLAMRCY